MLHDSETVDHTEDLSVTTAPAVDDGYEAFLDDVERNRQAELDAEMDEMFAAAEADGVDPAPWHDLSGRRYNQIVAMMPERTGWAPCIGYTAGAELPFSAELHRGTPDGPDVIRLASFSTAENALTCAVLHLVNMVLADKFGDAAAKDVIRRQIAYAKR